VKNSLHSFIISCNILYKRNYPLDEDEVYKGHFTGQAGRMQEMGECGTTQYGLARPLVNGTE